MEFYQLEAFVKVCEQKSFSKAAQSMFLSQPTISAHVMALEKELNAKLFDRSGREISLTPAGKVFYQNAINILKEKQKAVQELKYFMGSVEGELRLFSSTIPAVYVLPALIRDFNKVYPKVVFKVTQADSNIVLNTVARGAVELGISGMKIDNQSLMFIPLCLDELVLATPLSWPDVPNKIINVEDVFHQRLLVREKGSGTRRTFENELKKEGFNPDHIKIVAEFGSSESIKQAVKDGLGISVISKRAVEDYTEMNLIKIFYIGGIDLTRYFYFVFKRGKTLSPNAQTLIKFVVDYLKAFCFERLDYRGET
ncbi:MAG: LysR family transcriptional regulator [Thermoanaerobacterales bacterium]|nr:LysR family transcriptional regulator [Thermoanaerobacterales bacterium]